MTDKTDKLASALKRVKKVAEKHDGNVVMSAEITRADRELLTRTHWLNEILKGWYFLTRPDLAEGDTTAWYSNYWDFFRIYLERRYAKHYCLSAEASLELQIGNNLFPKQLIIIVPEGGSITKLPFDTSFVTYADPNNIPEERIEFNGLQIMPIALAICKLTPTYFRENSEKIEITLRSLQPISDLIKIILQHNFQRAAERIIGACTAFGMLDKAQEISQALLSTGIIIQPNNPFAKPLSHLKQAQYRSPYAARIELLWQKYRQDIIETFPKSPGLPKSPSSYLEKVEDLYEFDAYNSLSIEGYQVTEELIERVMNKSWNPSLHPEDANEKNALAARGYYEAFQSVKKSLAKILEGVSPGQIVSKDLSIWYQNLFAPAVRANIISAANIVGYRNDKVYIRNSRHVPPPKEAVLDAMETFFKCLQEEPEASVRAVLGHYIFVFIHPYMDGNGRTARFLLNTMLASGGYPWTVVQVKYRKTYIDALETAHTESNLTPFINYILEEMRRSEGLM